MTTTRRFDYLGADPHPCHYNAALPFRKDRIRWQRRPDGPIELCNRLIHPCSTYRLSAQPPFPSLSSPSDSLRSSSCVTARSHSHNSAFSNSPLATFSSTIAPTRVLRRTSSRRCRRSATVRFRASTADCLALSCFSRVSSVECDPQVGPLSFPCEATHKNRTAISNPTFSRRKTNTTRSDDTLSQHPFPVYCLELVGWGERCITALSLYVERSARTGHFSGCAEYASVAANLEPSSEKQESWLRKNYQWVIGTLVAIAGAVAGFLALE
jgi:hypothetical protein